MLTQTLKSNKENKVLNFINGGRGVGKTYTMKKYFLKTGKQVVYIRSNFKGGVVVASTDFKIK